MKEKYSSLPESLRENPYTVPDGYFINLQQYTLAQCQLTKMVTGTGDGDVPEGYFDQLSERIATKVAEQRLKETITEPGFIVPEGYFEHSEALLLLQQKLADQANESGFTVPTAYFETLQNETIRRTNQRDNVPIRKIDRPRWIAYAAAACIAITVGVFGVSKRSAENQTVTSDHLASVSDQEIFNYLELYGTDNDVTYISEQLNDFDEPAFGEGISEVSEEDIEAYLNHTL